MSRTVGPYNDVATMRVEGAYELCEGLDDGGRPVQILTLGATSSKDPARRGLLSDTVAWAYATAGPEDAPILVADLEAEQPYVVVLHDPRLRGADRIMDRLLTLGPATGPLPVGPAAAAQRAAHQLAAAQRSAAPASPSGPMSPPPQMSPPVVIIAPPKKRSQLVPILVGIGSVVVILALVVGVWALMSGGGDEPDGSTAETPDSSAVGDVTEAPSEGGEEERPGDEIPQWEEDAGEERVGGTLFAEDARTQTIAFAGWPFAFRVPGGFSCSEDAQSAVCVADDGETTFTVGWEDCGGGCAEATREALREALPYQPLQAFQNGDIGVAERTQEFGRWRGSLSVFTTTEDGAFHAWATVDALDFRSEEAWQVFNDVLNQAMAKAA
ncbi:flagellar basal body-associated FliL family protein [Glycomyces terrestris]|uniref:Uncharacterized protein n=1 Tax=Glycomyces terrestris TaxID=2493553 RepID=A0A426UYD4_9ACTN|nr:hypothetical protein [Glycomyces terrestris]RRR99581.1 hypothetical protein EIW28_12865 [Glycomyces terrestris]